MGRRTGVRAVYPRGRAATSCGKVASRRKAGLCTVEAAAIAAAYLPSGRERARPRPSLGARTWPEICYPLRLLDRRCEDTARAARSQVPLRSAKEGIASVSGICLPLRNASPAGLSRALRGAARGLALAGALWAAGCGFPSGPQGGGGQGPGHRQQWLGLSPEEELEVGRQAYREVLDKFAGRILSKNAPESERVRRVADRSIEATENRLLKP